MMKVIIRTSTKIITLIMLLHICSACSVIGYNLGKDGDYSKAEIKIREGELPKPNTAINITLENDVRLNGVFKGLSNDSLHLTDGNSINTKDVREIHLAEMPTSGRTAGLVIGICIDVIVIYKLMESSFSMDVGFK